MKSWSKPIISNYSEGDLSRIIRANAWSVNPEDDFDSFLDSADTGSTASVFFPENPGVEVQVEVIGSFWLAGVLVKELLTSTGERYTYKKINGYWVRM